MQREPEPALPGTLDGGRPAPAALQAEPAPSATVGGDAAAEALPAAEVAPEERLRMLEALIGAPREGQVFADAIREHCHLGWERWVHPLVEEHWPEALDAADYKKLRFLTCNLYASAPYTVLFCAQRPPKVVGWATGLGRALHLGPGGLNTGASVALKLFSRLFPEADQRRIVIIAAFIATIDHAFDHYMDELEPQERERRIKGLLDGEWAPDHGSLKLSRALQVAMTEGLPDEQRADFEAALARVKEWVESEVAGMTGVEDPRGLCWRLAGVEGTIDGLIFPVLQYAGEGARQWMYDVSLFTQMMDDWIDYEDDKKDIRLTPVIEGRWTMKVLEEKWADTVRGIEDLAKQAGMGTPSYQAFVRDAYVYMMRDVMEAMVHGVAA